MNTTESAAARYAGIETWDTATMVEAMVEGQLAAVSAVHAVRNDVARAVDAAAGRLAAGGRLFYLGAGTSGRIATLDAAELPPTFAWPADRAIALMAGGAAAYTNAIEGAEDDAEAAGQALARHGLTPGDVVIGVAASGRTPFVLGGLAYARKIGALTIGVANNPGSALSQAGEINIVPATGAEVVAGSTRMKAGTAQKAVLTCLSTGIFLRLGYVWRGRMVEMKPTNEKLHQRALAMVMELADAPEPEAREALEAGGNSIKLAVLMLLGRLDRDAAVKAMEAAGGRLHLALAKAADGRS